MIYGYLRCSTDEKKQDIDRQKREIKKLANGKVDHYYQEYESGTKVDRKELNSMLSILKEGDTIICTEVSRISRSTKQLCEIIDLAKEKKIKIIFGGFVLDCSKSLDAMTQGMIMMMGVFAEMERNIISERVKSGMANAREKGKIIGRKKTSIEDIPKKFIEFYPMFKSKKLNKSDLARVCELSRPSIDKYLKIMEENN